MTGHWIAVTIAWVSFAATMAGQDTATLTDRQRVVHLLSRLTFGPTPDLIREVEQLGIEAWVDAQLAGPQDDAMRARLTASYPTLELTSKAIYRDFVDASRGEDDDSDDEKTRRRALLRHAQRDLVSSVVDRAAYSRAQVSEVMVDFWRNHFNVDRDKDSVRYTATEWERTVLRAHVFGSFHDMLLASARHPAMLVYLDNHLSRRPPSRTELKTVARRVRQATGSRERGVEAARIAEQRGLNENYARELLELHTLGVDNGYRQRDVVHVARALTGWTVDRGEWVFEYRDDMHDHGDKFLLGTPVPREKKRNGHREGERSSATSPVIGRRRSSSRRSSASASWPMSRRRRWSSRRPRSCAAPISTWRPPSVTS